MSNAGAINRKNVTIRLSMDFARAKGMRNFIVESDCKEAVDLL